MASRTKTPKSTDEPTSSGKKEKSQAAKAVELVVCLGIAVLVALQLRAHVVQMYVIPSGSMEPTLQGRLDGGDRVLCSKMNYYFREPVRWEPFVFLYPHENPGADLDHSGENYIKRCIGLPGEVIGIARGDIYVKKEHTWERQVKPDSLQREIWIPVYDETFSGLSTEELGVFWKQAGSGHLQIKNGALEVDGAHGVHLYYTPILPGVPTPLGIPDRYVRRQVVRFACPVDGCGSEFVKTVTNQKITGRCPRCGTYLLEDSVIHYQRRSELQLLRNGVTQGEDLADGGQGASAVRLRSAPYHWVPDLRILTEATLLDESTQLVLEIKDTLSRFQAQVGVGKVTLLLNGTPLPLAEAAIKLAPGQVGEVEFYHLDGVLRFYLDGKEILTHTPLPLAKPSAEDHPRLTGVTLSVTGGRARLGRVGIDRDIYYFGSGNLFPDYQYPAMQRGGQFQLGPDDFMALGDNCPSSSDSRMWGAVPRKNLRGPALLIWWPPHRIRIIH